MGSGKSQANPSNSKPKNNHKTQNPNPNPKHLKPTTKLKKRAKQPHPPPKSSTAANEKKKKKDIGNETQQLSFFVNEYQSANSLKLSSLELDSIKGSSFVGEDTGLTAKEGDFDANVKSLGKIVKGIFGISWKEDLCEGRVVDGEIEPGSPAVLMLTTSALRSIDLLRGVRSMTKECHGVKLFSKHMKVEEQVASLKNRVNFASGTPSRVKELIDMEALGLTRLKIIVLDIHPDVKGYSLLTLPQVRDEFWDLYKNYFHQRLLQGDLFIHLFGPIPKGGKSRGKR